MSQLPPDKPSSRQSSHGFFQNIARAINTVFGRILAFFAGDSQLDAVAIPLEVRRSCTDNLNVQLPEGPCYKQNVMLDEYQLPQINFGQIKTELVATNPELATMASRIPQATVMQSWGLDNSIIKFPAMQLVARKEKDWAPYRPATNRFPYPKRNSKSARTKQSSCIPAVDFGKIRNELIKAFPSYTLIPSKPHHSPEEFPNFNKLPLELQVGIWKHAMDDIGARVVSLEPNKKDTPGIIQACQVSRYEARKKFNFCIARQGSMSLHRFLDVTNDILLLPNARFSTVVLEEMTLSKGAQNCLPGVTQIALELAIAEEAVSQDRISANIDLWNMLPEFFPQLKVLYVIVTIPSSEPNTHTIEGGIAAPVSSKLLWPKAIRVNEINRWPPQSRNKVVVGRLKFTKALARGKGQCRNVELRFAVMREL